MTASPLTIAYPPADVRFFCSHEWPRPRPCEPGILADCCGCGVQYAPCTATRIDVDAVMGKTWICPSCSEGVS